MPGAEQRPARLAGFRGAVSFLTLVPAVGRGKAPSSDIGKGIAYFPLIGAAVGGAVAVSAWAASLVLPVTVAALVAVGVGALLTGALHIDGLADTLDGYGGRSRARALEIMRDHAIGSYGVVGVILDVGLRVAVIAALLPRPNGLLYLVAAGALSRSAAAGLGAVLPQARAEGGHADVLGSAGRKPAALAVGLGVAIAVLFLGWHALLPVVAIGAGATLWGWHCVRRLGGMTGDTLGAASEGGEVVVLLLGVTVR